MGASATSRAEGAQLIQAAFAEAAASGREDWRRMNLGSLKNRILQATGRQFKESTWDVTTFSEFVALYPELVQIDRSVQPPLAEFQGTQPPAPINRAATDRRNWRIRADLWRAVTDYSSGLTYVWNGEAAVGMPAGSVPRDAAVLPPIDADTLARWRSEFREGQLASASADEVETLAAWTGSSAPGWQLSPRLRSVWFDTLKSRVREHLEKWFEQAGEPLPDGFVTVPQPRNDAVRRRELLRAFVIECVATMTDEELASLQLPAAAVLRVRGT